MNELFEREWELHVRGGTRQRVRGERPALVAAFDRPVRTGDVRVFADVTQPLVAAIVDDRGLVGFRAVPVSPFTVPSGGRECIVGDRVFQSWNAVTLPRRFSERSWLVDRLSPDDVARLADSVARASAGRVTAGTGCVAAYEREFLLPSGNLRPLVAPARRTGVSWGIVPLGRVAAALAILMGAWYVMFGESSPARGFFRGDGSERFVVELVDPVEPEEIVADADDEPEDLAPEVDVVAPAISPSVDAGQLAKLDEIRAGVETARIPSAAGLRSGGRRTFVFPSATGAFVDPRKTPTALIAFGGRETANRGSVSGFVAGPLPDGARATEPPPIECLLTTCPWDESHRLLNLRAPDADGLRISVSFDANGVAAYRLVPGGSLRKGLNAFYELVPDGLAAIAPSACSVVTRWRGSDGDEWREERVVVADADEIVDLPVLSRKKPPQEGLSSTNDIPVAVEFGR